MKSGMKWKLVILATAGLTVYSCTHRKKGNYDTAVRFEAKDLDLFPDYIDNLFPGSRIFTSQYPTLKAASAGIHFIEARRLTHDEVDYNEANLAWSQDGVNLGYEIITKDNRKIFVKNLEDDVSQEIVVMPKKKNSFLDGLLKRKIKSYNGSLRWSGDNTQYAFMSNGGEGLFNIYVGGYDKKEAPIAKSTKKDGYASWNPKQDEVVFVSARTGSGDLYAFDSESEKISQLTQTQETEMYPEWLPNGNGIVYASGSSRQHNLQFLRKKVRGWAKPQLLTNWQYDSLRPTVSPNGKMIAFYSNYSNKMNEGINQTWNLHVVKFDPYKILSLKELKNTIVAVDVVLDLNVGPAWTPDSKKVLYVKRDPARFNPIFGYDLVRGKRFIFNTKTKMNRDIQISKFGVLSFRAQVGTWDRVFLALTNQGLQLQGEPIGDFDIKYSL